MARAGRGRAVTSEAGAVEALPLDAATFLVDAGDPDTPTVTFGAFDDSGRPGVLYEMLWGLPRGSAAGSGCSPAASPTRSTTLPVFWPLST